MRSKRNRHRKWARESVWWKGKEASETNENKARTNGTNINKHQTPFTIELLSPRTQIQSLRTNKQRAEITKRKAVAPD